MIDNPTDNRHNRPTCNRASILALGTAALLGATALALPTSASAFGFGGHFGGGLAFHSFGGHYGGTLAGRGFGPRNFAAGGTTSPSHYALAPGAGGHIQQPPKFPPILGVVPPGAGAVIGATLAPGGVLPPGAGAVVGHILGPGGVVPPWGIIGILAPSPGGNTPSAGGPPVGTGHPLPPPSFPPPSVGGPPIWTGHPLPFPSPRSFPPPSAGGNPNNPGTPGTPGTPGNPPTASGGNPSTVGIVGPGVGVGFVAGYGVTEGPAYVARQYSAAPQSCFRKAYVDDKIVLIDMCTNQQVVVPPAGNACLAEQDATAGSVWFTDKCTTQQVLTPPVAAMEALALIFKRPVASGN